MAATAGAGGDKAAEVIVEDMNRRRAEMLAQFQPYQDPPAEAFALDEARGPVILGYSPCSRQELSIDFATALKVELPRVRAIPDPSGKGTRFQCPRWRSLLPEEEEAVRFPFLRQVIDVEDVAPDHVGDYVLAICALAHRLRMQHALAFSVARGTERVLLSRALVNMFDAKYERAQPMEAALDLMGVVVPWLVRQLGTFRADALAQDAKLELSVATVPALFDPPPSATDVAWTMVSEAASMACDFYLACHAADTVLSADVHARAVKKLGKMDAQREKLFARYLRLSLPASSTPSPPPVSQ